MPAEKNTAARIIVPLLLLTVAIVTVWGMYTGGSGKPKAPPIPAAGPAATPVAANAPAGTNTPGSVGAAEGAGGEPAPDAAATDGSNTPAPSASPAPAPSATTTPSPGAPAAPAAPLAGLRAKVVPIPLTAPSSIGSTDPQSGFMASYTFSYLGAGVESITLARHFETLKDKIKDQQRFRVQQPLGATGAAGQAVTTLSLAARAVIIDGTPVDLFGDATTNYWVETSAGVFSAEIVDAAGAPVARLTRAFTLAPGSYEVEVRQSFENLSGRDLKVQWVQYGPMDIKEEMFGYQLDTRRVRYGYLFDQTRDPSQSIVSADTLLETHAAPIAAADKNAANNAGRNAMLFPRPGEFKGAGDLVWVAQTSRYFAFACHPLLADGSTRPERFLLAGEVHAVPLGWGKEARLALELHSAQVEVKAGGAQDLSFAAYAGPLAKSFLSEDADPAFGVLGLSQMVVFNLGGCCAPCTFQWLAKLLLWYLELMHGILGDWTIAIMILVFTVRALLHPITRRSQINMTRFGKKMAALAPKQKKLQEQYKNDPKQMQVEMARLMREEGVSPTQALGCIPLFLQTPVWMALYAMLFFAFQFRHEPGFYGLFQTATGGNWSFLADLSAPDHFFEFGTSFHIPLISGLMGDISGINLLPLVLGVVFWVQQKYLTPPATTALTPEQEMQQKMMKVMMVVMFPVMMYNAPSGLAVYFITNSVLGIIESRWIRAHIDELDKSPPPAKPVSASVKPGNSIWDRVQAAAEQRKKVENEAAAKRAKGR